jgi:hypothetical protein
VSDFFEPPPPPPEPQEHRHPEWFGPPENVLAVVVPLELELARTADLVLAVRGVDVYPSGALFHVPLLLREQVSDPMEFMPFHPRHGREGDFLKLGVQYADGAKATNLGMPFFPRDPEERPRGPILMPRGGGGGGRSWDVSFWLWPLPKEDPFALVIEWPARQLPLSRFDVPVAPLVEAATRCEELWPEGAGGGSGGAGGMTQLMIRSRG